MKKIKAIYSWRGLFGYAKSAALSLATGLLRLLWAGVLLVINIAVWTKNWTADFIRTCPYFAVGSVFVIMGIGHLVTYTRVKVRLTTAEWQRDSLELRLDSIKVMDGGNVTYYRYRPYKGE